MSQIVIDEELRKRLNGLKTGTRFCDSTGHPLGYFVSEDDYMALLYARAKLRFTPEEIESLRRQEGGRSLKDILSDLERR